MSEAKTFEGGCHCGAVRFEATVDPTGAIECNCSHCEKKGFILAFAPATDFRLLSGESALTEYRFNKKQIAHLFCSRCGVQSFGRGVSPEGAEMAAVNLRCLDGIDLAALSPSKVDGRSF